LRSQPSKEKAKIGFGDRQDLSTKERMSDPMVYDDSENGFDDHVENILDSLGIECGTIEELVESERKMSKEIAVALFGTDEGVDNEQFHTSCLLKIEELKEENEKLKEEIKNIVFCDKCGLSDYNHNDYHHCECSTDED
jgi:plasmid maintenance system antidote protein VapI